MREILFRGKRKDNDGWLWGDLLQDRDLGTCLIEGFDYYTDEDGLQRDYFQHEVIPETVGQYTGLTDKNGNKIFEGDVLEIYQSKVGKYKAVVCWGNEWEKNAFVLSYRGTAWDYLKVLNDPFKHIKYYEVMGNIYDNPKLLEVHDNERQTD